MEPPYDGNTLSQFDIQTKVVNERYYVINNSSLQSLIERACKKNETIDFKITEWEEALRNYKSATISEDKTIVKARKRPF